METDTSAGIMTEPDFGVFVEQQVEWLKSRMKDKPESIMPHLAIKTIDIGGNEGLTLCALAVDFNEHNEKKEILMQLGRKTYSEEVVPVAIALSCEAWMARNPQPGVQPRDCSDKQEVVMVAAETLGQMFGKGFGKMVAIPVARDENNGMVAQEEGQDLSKASESRFYILDHFYRGFFEVAMAKSGGRA